MNCSGQSEVGEIESILLKHPRDAFLSQRQVDSRWQGLCYDGAPEFEKAVEEYESFVNILSRTVGQFHFLPADEETDLDSIYVHDPVIITRRGAILCNMGKPQRRGEPGACGRFLSTAGVPTLGAITAPGMLEGGDVVWLDEKTPAVGQGYRTNAEGIRQLKQLLAGLVEEIVVVPLPHWDGPTGVMHLMSLISPIDYDLALVYSRLLPVWFREWLLERGIRLVEVPDGEFPTMGGNVLAMAPRKCLMLSGNPMTKVLLEREGVDVMEYVGDEISTRGAGGPTCLTRPLIRKR